MWVTDAQVKKLRKELDKEPNLKPRSYESGLIRKPGAFARYRYREDLFPDLLFRRAYDDLLSRKTERNADIEYLRILHLAASTSQSDVEIALQLALASTVPLSADLVRSLVKPAPRTAPTLTIGEPSSASYDRLIAKGGQ